MTVRVYVPGDWESLGETVAVSAAAESAGGEPVRIRMTGHAVTDALRDALPDLDEEELEHYAMTEAAQDSLRGSRDEGEPPRRLVLALDADAVAPVADDVSRVQVDGVAVPRDVVAWLVDTADAEPAVEQAVGALALGTDVEEALERCLDHELAWYAATEADEVLGLR